MAKAATPGMGPGLTGSATTDLGLGDLLAQQVAGETEEERKKRMAQIAQQKQVGGSPASAMLLGTGGLSGIGSTGY